MIYFNSDYNEGAHPNILARLQKTNFEQTPGYGKDEYCLLAAERIKNACQAPRAEVHFLTGGTQTNLTVIAAALRPFQGVLSADSGHVNVHETGAIESTGHKVLALASHEGKIAAQQVDQYCQNHMQEEGPEHMVQPRMVYISHPTECGTLYTKAELEAIHSVCQKHQLYLFIDGARLPCALAAKETDVTLPLLARYSDVFYIGGTKSGALFGEALVILHPALQKDFRYMLKNRGALLAKGRLLGIQFLTLFENELYLELGARANRLSQRIRQALELAGVPLWAQSPTNMQFPIFTQEALTELSRKYVFSFIGTAGSNKVIVRICTSWATKETQVEELISDITRICGK